MRRPSVDPATFVGREAELAEVRAALTESHLVTLVGPGGVGKTTLAVRAGVELMPSFADGVVFVDLSAVVLGEDLGAAFASALGVQGAPGATAVDAVADHLRGREVLVVVDNCEQVLDAAAVVCERLALEGDSRILATSRAPLRTRAEMILTLDPLALPHDDARAADSEAVRLFVDRARRARRPFTLDASNVDAVVEVCRLLDGLPLAIELAAARSNAFSPAQLAVELRAHRSLLREDAAVRPDRHRSLEACVEWSIGLLDDLERSLLGRLAVFAGGFDLDAARAVCADDRVTIQEMPAVLGRLVDASVVAVDHRSDGRFRLLDTIRHHARDRLAAADTDRWGLRHLMWAESAASRVEALHRSDDPAAHDAFVRERQNLFGAIAWATEHDHVADGMQIIGSLLRVCSDFGVHEEVTRSLAALFASAPADLAPEARLAALLTAASMGNGSGDLAATLAHATEAVALAQRLGDGASRGWAHLERGFARVALHDPDARVDLEEAVAIATSVGDADLEADALIGLGMSTALTTDVTAGVAQLERAALLAGSRSWLVPAASAFLGATRLHAGDLAGSVAALDRSLAASRRRPMGHHFFFTPFATAVRAIALAHGGRADAALADLDATLSTPRDRPHPIVRSVLDVAVAVAHHFLGDIDDAVEAYQRALTLGLDPFWSSWASLGLADLAVASGEIEIARDHAARVREQTARTHHHFHVARLELMLALIARSEGDELDATARASAALISAVERGNGLLIPDAVEVLACLAVRRGEPELGARLLGAAEGERMRTGHVRSAVAASRLKRDLGEGAMDSGPLAAARRDAAGRPVDDVLTLAVAGRGSRRRPSLGWASLTPAERNVVRLVAEGLSNPAIGERLYISRRTVERHLSNIFTKTGVTSRAQLAAEAVRLSD